MAAFIGSAIAVFTRNPSTGALTQPSDSTGCLVETATTGCTTGLALGDPEGVAVSPDGANVYVAAPGSNAVDTFARNASTGALTQPTDGTGCIVGTALSSCTTGIQLAGADALTVSPNGANVYVTSALSNSLTTFTRSSTTGQLTQLTGTSACVINLLAVGCSLGRVLSDPEGLAVSPDGATVYVTAFKSGALDVFDRNADSGAVDAEAARAGMSAGERNPRLPAWTRTARRELGRCQPRRSERLLGGVRQRLRRHLQTRHAGDDALTKVMKGNSSR